jgi:hypothetical protein
MNGDFVESWDIPFATLDFARIDEDRYAFYNGSYLAGAGRLQIFSKRKQTVLQSYLPVSQKQASFLHFEDLTNFSRPPSGSWHFLHAYNDTIYQLNGESLQPKWVLDFGAYDLPPAYLKESYANVAEFFMAIKDTDFVRDISGFFETDSAAVFGFRYKDLLHHVFLDKGNMEPTVVSEYRDDTLLRAGRIPASYQNLPKAIQGDKLFFVFEPYYLIECFEAIQQELSGPEWEQYLQDRPEQRALYESLTLTDNPVIVTATLKGTK